ncbi:hypothetical protein MTR67_026867 [Solanum verrucosum]|uniref:Uncharacterized protein n=1 Tax=Solanum verrucosum TaxID=315347 RepID=A0AAF0R3Y3_SOLVR|nr:hypothetical protein MTR67_026867 [Solanum verrucosum]
MIFLFKEHYIHLINISTLRLKTQRLLMRTTTPTL